MKDSIFKKYGDKLLFVLALSFLAVLLFQLAGKKAGTGGHIFQPAAPALVFTQWWEDDLEEGSLPDLVKEFETLHPGIKIVLRARSYEELRQDLFNPGEDQPPGDSYSGDLYPGDLLALDPLWVPELLKRGIIESRPEYGPPLLSFINVLYYNIDILKEAGFSRPPKSRGEFLDYARELAKNEEDGPAPDLWGLVLGGNNSRWIYDDILPWIWAAGAVLINDGQPAVSSRAVVESLSFLAALNSEGLISPGAFSADAGEKLEAFCSGKAAFMIAPASEIRHVRERMGDGAFSVTSVPMPDNYAGKAYYGTAEWTAGIYSASRHKEEAGLFADFLAEKNSLLAERAGAIQGSSSPLLMQDPFYSKAWDLAIAGEGARDFDGLPWQEMEGIFREELAALFSGKNTPAETAGAIQEKWEAALDGGN